jgi:hypothetical protein
VDFSDLLIGFGLLGLLIAMVVYIEHAPWHRAAYSSGQRKALKEAIDSTVKQQEELVYGASEGNLRTALIGATAIHDVEMALRDQLRKIK